MDLAIQNFRVIRKVNPVVDVVSGVVLSAVTCRNTGLCYTEKGNNVGIFTAAGLSSAAFNNLRNKDYE